jgi:hypothetical protein
MRGAVLVFTPDCGRNIFTNQVIAFHSGILSPVLYANRFRDWIDASVIFQAVLPSGFVSSQATCAALAARCV